MTNNVNQVNRSLKYLKSALTNKSTDNNKTLLIISV